MTPQEAYSELINLFNSSRRGIVFYFKDFINAPEHKKEVDELKKIIIQDPFTASDFAISSGERWIEAEEIIKTNPKILSHYFCMLFTREFKRRWNEAEADILKGTPNSVWDYYKPVQYHVSNSFPDNVWIEAEPVFEKKMSIFHQYVLTTKKPNKTYEQKILNDPSSKYNPKYIYDYSSKVLQSRWKEAEHIILKNPDYAAKYCSKFKMVVPEEIHNQIVAEVALTDKSSSFRKKFLQDQTKRKEKFLEYLKELVSSNVINKDSTVEELINNI